MDNNLVLAASYFYSLSGNVELMQILNHLGHGISYSQLEEADTSPCLQKLAMTPENGIPLPSNIYPGTNTVLALILTGYRELCPEVGHHIVSMVLPFNQSHMDLIVK